MFNCVLCNVYLTDNSMGIFIYLVFQRSIRVDIELVIR